MNIKYAIYRVFKKPFFGRFERPWHWPADVSKDGWKRVSVDSESGAKLSALIGESDLPRAKGAILLAHPMGAIAKGFWLKHGHAQMLREAGYHVMVFDLNGFGESTNTSMDYQLDVLSSGKFLHKTYPNLPVGLMGASMGASMGVCSLSRFDHPFKVAVLESAFPTLLSFWSNYPIPKLGVQLAKLIHPKGELRLRPTHAVENLKGEPEVLLIYGSKDRLTPVSEGKKLAALFKAKTKTYFHIIDGADHTTGYKTAPETYAGLVLQFLERHLDEATNGHPFSEKALNRVELVPVEV